MTSTPNDGIVSGIRKAPNKHPFDWSMLINLISASRLSQSTPLSENGFDVTVIGPSTPLDLLKNASPQLNSISLLEEGEKGKFMRQSAARTKKLD